MPKCQCGFNFAKGRLDGRRIEAFAVVRDDDWLNLMSKEKSIRAQKDSDKKLSLIYASSKLVGNLMRCPECGLWILMKPKAHRLIRLKPSSCRTSPSAGI